MGMALVRSEADAQQVINALKKAGFDAYSTSVTLKGAKDSVKTRVKL